MATKKVEIQRTDDGKYICRCCGKAYDESEMCHNGFGVTSVCSSCNSKNRSAAAKKRSVKNTEINELKLEIAELKRQLKESTTNALKQASGRDLLLELKSRGCYEGDITIVKRTTIKLQDFE